MALVVYKTVFVTAGAAAPGFATEIPGPAPPVQTIASPPQAAEREPKAAEGNGFISEVLAAHNRYRAEHGAAALSWNDSLADFAQSATGSCVFEHTGGPFGENLAAGYKDATSAINAWGDERKDFDFNNEGFGEGTGHFTQVVWKSTDSVGCGRKQCNTDTTPGEFFVCEYSPPGNVQGLYRENVGPQVQ
ncbi:MAG: hypothetical protein M1825_000151 [Sarcosagium campestre]|nr:MAG: hypothetical protein M1825_000151 [Sarcosagium campestre]